MDLPECNFLSATALVPPVDGHGGGFSRAGANNRLANDVGTPAKRLLRHHPSYVPPRNRYWLVSGIPAQAYLLDLSVIAITFPAVSAVVILRRCSATSLAKTGIRNAAEALPTQPISGSKRASPSLGGCALLGELVGLARTKLLRFPHLRMV